MRAQLELFLLLHEGLVSDDLRIALAGTRRGRGLWSGWRWARCTLAAWTRTNWWSRVQVPEQSSRGNSVHVRIGDFLRGRKIYFETGNNEFHYFSKSRDISWRNVIFKADLLWFCLFFLKINTCCSKVALEVPTPPLTSRSVFSPFWPVTSWKLDF